MKKLFTVFAAVLLVLSFAGAALAIHAEIPAETQAVVATGTNQITLSGLIRVRSWHYDNVGTVGDNKRHATNTASHGFYDQRVVLKVDAKISPNVQGVFTMQADRSTWGGLNYKTFGNTTTPTTVGPTIGSNAASATDLGFIEAWIQYSGSGLFGFPSFIKIGHMPLALGNQQFFQHTTNGDDAIVVALDPNKDLHIGLLTFKAHETTTGWGAANTIEDTDAYVALMTYKLDPKNTIGANYTLIRTENGNGFAGMPRSFQNIGLHANGNVSGLGYKAEVDFQFGDQTATVDFAGLGIMANVNYKVDAANLKAGIGYGSGNKTSTAKNEAFTTFLSDIEHFTQLFEYRVNLPGNGNNAGLTNTTYYTLGLDYDATKDLKLSLDGYILRATQAVNSSKDAGWEADFKAQYQVAKNLKYVLDAAYLNAGNAFGSSKKAASLVRQQLILNF